VGRSRHPDDHEGHRRGPACDIEPLASHRPAPAWVAAQHISTHWLRHTTLTWIERHYGYAIAHEYAGHHDKTDATTPTYLHADIHDLAIALTALTNENHPLTDIDDDRWLTLDPPWQKRI
jgi:integrase